MFRVVMQDAAQACKCNLRANIRAWDDEISADLGSIRPGVAGTGAFRYRPPGRTSIARRCCALFQLDDRHLPPETVGDELDFAALGDLLEHRFVGDVEHHRHRRHVEVGQFLVLHGDLLLLGIDLGNLALGELGS